MAQKKRTKAARARAKRAYAARMAQALTTGESPAGADGGTAAGHPHAEAAEPAVNNETSLDSPFWTELSPANRAIAIAAGRGDGVELMDRMRLTMRAVNEQWNIPRDMRDRMVFEAFRIVIDQKASHRDRNMANRLLVMMVANNRPGTLPVQINIGMQHDSGPSTNELLDELRNDPSIIEALDYREYKPEPGSADDYAD